MVNNNIKRACNSRSFLLFFFLSICSITNAQKISKFYTSSMQDDGILYFIEPKQEFKNKKEHCKFIYDLTYLTVNDSISLNFTYSDNLIREIDSIVFIQEKIRLSSKAEKIFIETNKNVWKHRYSGRFSFNDFNEIFKQDKQALVLVYFQNKTIQLEINNKKWKKTSTIISKIFSLIKANRKKSP